jgi:hypothetical protein
MGLSLQCGVSYIADVPAITGVSDAVCDPAVSGVPVVAFIRTELLMSMLIVCIFVTAGVHVVCFCLLPVSPNGGWHWHKT